MDYHTLARSEPAIQQGFAIPINTARAVAEELVLTGLSHPTVGVRVRPLTPCAGAGLQSEPGQHGLPVTGTPRSKVTSPSELFHAVESTGAGGRLQLSIWRQNQEQQVTVVPEEMAEQINRAMRDTVTTPPPFPWPLLIESRCFPLRNSLLIHVPATIHLHAPPPPLVF